MAGIRTVLILAAGLLTGCSTLNEFGIGGPPGLIDISGKAYIDDRLLGSDENYISLIRRFKAGDALVKPASAASQPT